MLWIYRHSLDLGARQSGADDHRACADHRAERGRDRYEFPRAFSRTQDTGMLMGQVQGPQDASFPFMNFSVQHLVDVVKADPAVAHVMPIPAAWSATAASFSSR